MIDHTINYSRYKTNYPPFAWPAQFADLTGLSAKEVRKLCRQRILPCERTRKGFRIDVEAGLETLRVRAATFTGHDPIPPNYRRTDYRYVDPQQAWPTKAREGNFFAALDALKGGRN